VDLIRQLAPTLSGEFLLGAGAVTDAATAAAVIDAGARFVVSPVFRPEVVRACLDRDVPAMPGCFSPTEILAAHDGGADIIKVFPATALGPQFIKDVRAPLPQVKLMPTGGVSLDNAGDWIRAGAAAVGVGSALLDAAAIESGRYEVITANAKRIIAGVAAARAKK
ncbi:MAG: 2-dehydro-3-deoxyphosphogluconate aldolase, partial [Acidobacteria bacterium]